MGRGVRIGGRPRVRSGTGVFGAVGLAGALAAAVSSGVGAVAADPLGPPAPRVLADERAPSPWALATAAPRPTDGELEPTPGFFAPPEALVAQERECTGQAPDRFYEFYFTRAIYNAGGGFGGRRGRRGGGSWSVDYPKADCQFITVVKRLSGLDMYYDSNAIALDDPNLRRFPFLYALEVGQNGGWDLSESEATGLRDYLTAGGFLVVDDFWGTYQWNDFYGQLAKVFPDREVEAVPMDHPIFHSFYDIDEILQVPNIGNARRGGPTWEGDGYTPYALAIFDDARRPMVMINYNTDLGDAWEHADDPGYPHLYSGFAYRMGINFIVYSMTH
jgi:hypothetical protein